MNSALATLAAVLFPLELLGEGEADLKAEVLSSARKLAEKPSYTWKTSVESAGGGGPFGGGSGATTGRIEKEGYTWVASTGGGALEFATKGGKAAVVLDGNWMTLDEASQRETGEGRGPGGPSRFDPRVVTELKLPTAHIEDLLAKAANFKRTDEGFGAEFPAESASELLSSSRRGFGGRRGGRGGAAGGRGGPPGGGMKDPKGVISFSISRGALTRLTIQLSGSREFGGNEVKLDRTTTTRFSEIGSTKVAVPADAEAIIDALLAGKPSPVFVPEPGFKKLFNGRDLAGWIGRPENWSVEDGAIKGRVVASGTKDDPAGTCFLIALDGKERLVVDDFELRLSYRIADGGDRGSPRPGVVYRGEEHLDFAVAGSRADFEPGTNSSGGAWNDFAVIAQGNRRQHFLSGAQAAGVVDEPDRKSRTAGILALQPHAREPMTVHVKNVRLKPLNTPELQGASNLRVAKDFAIDLLYTVPRDREGSWVAMCLDPKGRLIVSDQNGGLFRVTLPADDRDVVRTERLEAIVDPSKTISDQYEAIVIRKKNGQIVTGRIGNLSGSSVNVVENMLDPGAMTGVRRSEILSIEPSKVSPMPDGLLNTLRTEEIQDLVAYLLSRGDPQNSIFR